MNMKNCLPFEAGQMVESKSFIKGYRGAWFRCKIKELRYKRGLVECALEYCDFPDEKVRFSAIYEVPRKTPGASSGLDQRKRELMLRPLFPPFHRESELPLQHSPAEVTAVVNDAWRVGDLVDLSHTGCYWSGKIIKLLDDDAVEVELLGPPNGEGGVYKGVHKDIRPSFNWSLEKGWSVPTSQGNGDSWYTARLVQQPSWRSMDNESGQGTVSVGNAMDQSNIPCIEARKETPSTSNALSEDSNPNFLSFGRDLSNGKTKAVIASYSTPETSSTCHNNHKSRNIISSNDQPSIRESKYLETQPDRIDESIMELEEVANKIRWLKGLLQFGFTWSNDMKPSWKFLPNSEM